MTDSSTCPLCGNHLDFNGLVLLPDRGMVGRNGTWVTLTRSEMQIFTHLHKHCPLVVSREALLDQMYQLADYVPVDKILDIFVCKIRTKVKPLNVTIATERGVGYRLGIPYQTLTVHETLLSAEPAA